MVKTVFSSYWAKLGLVALVSVVLVLASFAYAPMAPKSIRTIFYLGREGEIYARTPDAYMDGTDDDVEVQHFLDAHIPATGGKIVIYGGDWHFNATVTRDIPNVTIEGSGKSTSISKNGSTPLFDVGSQTGWMFLNMCVDGGGIDGTFGVDNFRENVWIGTIKYNDASDSVIARGTFTTSSATVPADNTSGIQTKASNYYRGCVLMTMTGAVAYQPRPIGEFTTGTGVFTLDEPFTSAPGLVAYVVMASDYPFERLEELEEEIEIVENHIHPDLSVTTPNGRLRVGALTYNSAPANTENITIVKTGGTKMTYRFQTTLTNPENATIVNIKVQATTALSAQKIMYAFAGVTDAANITYYNNVAAANTDFVAPYTTQRVSIAAALHSAGATNIFIARVGDSATACTITNNFGDTGGVYKLTQMTRIYTQRYTMTGNATPATNSIAGAYQCIVPMMSVWHPTELVLVDYDIGKIIVEATSDQSMIVECDGYWSMDEVTFYPLWYGLELSREPATAGSQTFLVSSHRIPAGAGFYVKMRSNLTSATEWVDFKAQYHLYPSALNGL